MRWRSVGRSSTGVWSILEVTGVHHEARRRAQGDAAGVGNAVANAEILGLDRAEPERIAGLDTVQLVPADAGVLAELDLYEVVGERGRIDRHV